MRKINFKWAAVIIILVLCLVGYGLYRYFNTSAVKMINIPPVVVTQMTVKSEKVPSYLEAIATVISPRSVLLSMPQSGLVKSVAFKAGQQVSKGQVLLVLNHAIAKADVQKSKAALASSEATYKSYLRLSKEDPTAVLPNDLKKYLSTYKQDLAALSLNQATLAQMTLKAPFSGTMSAPITQQTSDAQLSSQLSPGFYLSAGTPVAYLVDSSHMMVEYPVPVSQMDRIQKGQAITASLASQGGTEELKGHVEYIAPQVNLNTQSVTLRGILKHPKASIKAGQQLYIHQKLKETDKILIPGLSLVPSIAGYSVYVVKDGKVDTKAVEVGERYNTNVAITKGLRAGDKIIVSDINQVSPGQSVKVK